MLTSAISGRPARAMVNKFIALGEQADLPETPSYPRAYDAGKALHTAAKAKGDFGYGAQWAGQAVQLARALPAAELMVQLEREMRAAISALGLLVA